MIKKNSVHLLLCSFLMFADCNSADLFLCSDGYCTLGEYRCDGEVQCADASDEAGCDGNILKYHF